MAMNRLALPKRIAGPTLSQWDSELTGKMSVICPGIPPNPLPTWTTLPFDSKLPMIPGPKKAVSLYTTNLGVKIHKSSQELDFDLTDPYSVVMSNNYKPLHDPHLKPHLTNPAMRRRLYYGGFITKDGKVLCTLREFNEYRQYLRKINLALERRNQAAKKVGGQTPSTRRVQDGSGLARSRERKVKQIRERLARQHAADKARNERLRQEEEERQQRLCEDKETRLTELEYRQRQLEERHQATLKRRQQEEKRRRMRLIARWMADDAHRRALAESRQLERDKTREQKLEESWDARKRLQQARIDEEERQRQIAEEATNKRIRERERMTGRQRERQQRTLLTMTEQRRREKERMEEEYARKFAAKMEKKRTESIRKRRRHGIIGKRHEKIHMKSNWDLEKTLLQSFSDDEGEFMRFAGLAQFGDGGSYLTMLAHSEIEDVIRQEKQLDKTLSELGLGDFKGAAFTEEVLNVAKSKAATEADCYVATPKEEETSPKLTTNDLGITDFRGANFTPEITDDKLLGPDYQEGGSNVRFSTQSWRKNSLTELEQIVRAQKIKSRRLTCPKGYGHGDITQSRGVIPAQDSMEQDEDEEEEYEELSPAEVTAKVIVDISLYLTTKVIYPAYMRFLKEDQPDVYKAYREGRTSSGSPISPSELDLDMHQPEAGDQVEGHSEHPG